ncbi:MAG TPA: hypothetical protein IAA52_06235 [Candidatus Pullichristensenella stercorigallinarum]|uniref:Uncharacterized protein n=1 Tax=Candidatus Pullichristensenella stercorigallinarum TaxID=2840909 RepID=A0A9D1CWE2_9FIRM|nr:hypothetical protein [Candidatus Pullichristensenella stercorigallinarum]
MKAGRKLANAARPALAPIVNEAHAPSGTGRMGFGTSARDSCEEYLKNHIVKYQMDAYSIKNESIRSLLRKLRRAFAMGLLRQTSQRHLDDSFRPLTKDSQIILERGENPKGEE